MHCKRDSIFIIHLFWIELIWIFNAMFKNWVKNLVNKLYSKPYLLLTNTATGVVSISIGDVLQQNLEHALTKDEKIESTLQTIQQTVWDSSRTKNMMLAGVYFSAFGHFWYSFLDRRFPPKSPSAVRKKLLAEIVMGPPLVSSVFFVVGSLKGHSLPQSWEYLKSNFPVICGVCILKRFIIFTILIILNIQIKVEWLVYIPLQWLNFSYVPAQFRYLYVATISIGYGS